MPRNSRGEEDVHCHPRHRKWTATVLVAAVATAAAPPVKADPNCQPITATALQIDPVDCSQVLPQLQASGQFPDVFAGAGKIFGVCYMAKGPVAAQIGNTPVTITNTLSAWTTDFVPTRFGGHDNLATVVTQVTVTGPYGVLSANYFTRDTIDLSGIDSGTSATANEEDVIVGGDSYLLGARGTYRVASTVMGVGLNGLPIVALTSLTGIICTL
jgi:hypothetical protein